MEDTRSISAAASQLKEAVTQATPTRLQELTATEQMGTEMKATLASMKEAKGRIGDFCYFAGEGNEEFAMLSQPVRIVQQDVRVGWGPEEIAACAYDVLVFVTPNGFLGSGNLVDVAGVLKDTTGKYSENTKTAVSQMVNNGTTWRDHGTIGWMRNIDEKEPNTMATSRGTKPQWLINNGIAEFNLGTDKKIVPGGVYTAYTGMFRITDPALVSEATNISILAAQQNHQPGIEMANVSIAAAAVVKQAVAPTPNS